MFRDEVPEVGDCEFEEGLHDLGGGWGGGADVECGAGGCEEVEDVGEGLRRGLGAEG